jgi:hypothetical protein
MADRRLLIRKNAQLEMRSFSAELFEDSSKVGELRTRSGLCHVITPQRERIARRGAAPYQDHNLLARLRVYTERKMGSLVRKTGIVLFAGLFAAVLVAGSVTSLAQEANFIVSQHGQEVGTASFHIASGEGGYDSTSMVRVEMQGLDYALSKTEELSSSQELKQVQLSATVNSEAVNVTATPDGAQLTIGISANGRRTTTHLDTHGNAVFLPDFDPGALETLLKLAAAHNNRDLWAIVPKQAGSVAPISLATYADEQGTFDGKPVTVHHILAIIAGASTDLFSGPENQLLQAELPQEGFALVKKGFVLKPPAKPITPAE